VEDFGVSSSENQNAVLGRPRRKKKVDRARFDLIEERSSRFLTTWDPLFSVEGLKAQKGRSTLSENGRTVFLEDVGFGILYSERAQALHHRGSQQRVEKVGRRRSCYSLAPSPAKERALSRRAPAWEPLPFRHCRKRTTNCPLGLRS